MLSIALAVCSVFLAAAFGWAGLSKAARPERWRLDLEMYRLPRLVRGLSFMVLPWIELALAAAFVFGEPWAAAPLLALLVCFCVVIVRARLLQQSNKLTCGCFGGREPRDYRLLLLRNAFIAGVATFVLVPGIRPGSNLPWSTGRWMAIPLGALLLAVGVAAILWIAWQFRAHLRRVAQADGDLQGAALAAAGSSGAEGAGAEERRDFRSSAGHSTSR